MLAATRFRARSQRNIHSVSEAGESGLLDERSMEKDDTARSLASGKGDSFAPSPSGPAKKSMAARASGAIALDCEMMASVISVEEVLTMRLGNCNPRSSK